jgi:VanZ family protein
VNESYDSWNYLMKRFNFVFYSLPAIIYLIITFVLSSMSHPPVPPRISDTILHLVEFAVFYILVYRALNRGILKKLNMKCLLLSLLLLAIYGGLDEFHQSFVPFRDCSFKDWLMDIAGSSLGLVSALLIGKRFQK